MKILRAIDFINDKTYAIAIDDFAPQEAIEHAQKKLLDTINNLTPIKDLMGGDFKRYANLERVKKSERGELVRFFSEAFERTPRLVGIRLAHYSVSDLYALKSAYNDRLQRNGKTPAIKYLWAITRTEKKLSTAPFNLPLRVSLK